MRNYLIAGNWKMNKTTAEAVEFAEAIKNVELGEKTEAGIMAPFTQLAALKEALAGTEIKVGAQNCHFEASGAYTGEISVGMLKEIGVDYCVIGHSERREYFNETDADINKKLRVLIDNEIVPILCVGEPLEVREADNHASFVAAQIMADVEGLGTEDMQKIVIAYEPIWAIGTGKTATPDEAEYMCGYIRGLIAGLYDNAVAENLQILYGGSMKPENAAELMARTDIDGGLIGGASLKADSFAALINAANEAK